RTLVTGARRRTTPRTGCEALRRGPLFLARRVIAAGFFFLLRGLSSTTPSAITHAPTLPSSFELPQKEGSPGGASGFAGLPSFFCLYSTFSAEIKALRRNKMVFPSCETIKFGSGG